MASNIEGVNLVGGDCCDGCIMLAFFIVEVT
jgi:hypothetical protein